MNRVAALKSKNHELQHQPGASLDKVIDEISSKLALLSGQDCEIEVNIRVKFPNNNKLNDRGNRRSAKASSKAIIQGSRHQEKEEIEKQRPKKIEQLHSQQQQQQQPPPQQSSHHKLRDFAFDIESYAKVDTRDSPSTSEHMPLANAIKRPASPDIITFGGMCNVDSEMAGGGKKSAASPSCSTSSCQSNSRSAAPSSSTTVSTNQIFPKGAIHYHKQK